MNTAPQGSTWVSKFFASAFVILAFINTLLMLVPLLPLRWMGIMARTFHQHMLAVHVLPALLLAFITSLYWNKKERNNQHRSSTLTAISYAITRYWLSFAIGCYGFAKIFQTQFAHSFMRDDMPAGNLNGFALTWHYFFYSYTLTVIIGLLQIAGACLLLFRRTTLLGVTILLPVLINILLINIFYHIAADALLNSIILTAGLLYVLLLRWQDLKKVFLYTRDSMPAMNLGNWSLVLKLVPLLAACLLIRSFIHQKQPASITGKWKVDTMIRDGDTVKQDAWLNNSRVWSNIYLEDDGQLIICANPYVLDNTKIFYGTYQYNSLKNDIKMVLITENDSFHLHVDHYQAEKMKWQGFVQNDTTTVFLSRYPSKPVRQNW